MFVLWHSLVFDILNLLCLVPLWGVIQFITAVSDCKSVRSTACIQCRTLRSSVLVALKNRTIVMWKRNACKFW